jgi:hypothetical protein
MESNEHMPQFRTLNIDMANSDSSFNFLRDSGTAMASGQRTSGRPTTWSVHNQDTAETYNLVDAQTHNSGIT